MADVKICDRCGEKLERNCFISLKPVRYILRREINKRCMWETFNDIGEFDLCKSCAADLDEFMKGKAKEDQHVL